jgi:hypothetical protein
MRTKRAHVSKNTSRQRANPEFDRARAEIRGAKSVHRGLAKYKSTANLGEMRRVLPDLVRHPGYRSLLWPNPTPKSYNLLGGGGIPVLTDFNRELLWCVQTLLPHVHIIREFLKQKSLIEEAFLRGDAEAVATLLKHTEGQFGVSLWLAETTINYLQTFKSYNQQREFTDAITVIQGTHPLIRYLVSWMSSRSSQNTAPRDFYNLLDEVVPRENGFATLTHIILGDTRIDSSEMAARAITFTDMFPVVDRYLLMMSIVQAYAASLAQGDSDLDIMRSELQYLSETIIDSPEERFFVVIGAAEKRLLSPGLLGIFDLYAGGKYAAAMDEAQRLLDRTSSVEALLVALKSARKLRLDITPFSNAPASSPIRKISEDLKKIVNYGQDAREAHNRLSKIVLSNSNTSWAASLALVIERYQRDDRAFGLNTREVYFAFRAMHESPRLSIAFQTLGSGGRYLELLHTNESDSVSVQLASAVLNNSNWEDEGALPPGRIAKNQALTELRIGEAGKATTILRSLYEGSEPSVRAELGQALVESLLRCSELQECCSVSLELFHISESFSVVLPLDRILNAIITAQRNGKLSVDFFGSLPAVLIFDIYSRYVSPRHDPDRADAFKDFLVANKLRYASDLVNGSDRFYLPYLVQFLKHVCVPEVLDQSLALASTRAVEDERAKILVLLSELTAAEGKPPASELLEELSTIKTRQVVRDTTLRLDQSKVYVNVDGIKKAVSGQLREMWNRYKLLASQQDATGLADLQKVLQAALGERVTLLSLTLPLTEGNNLFKRILSEVLELFSLSKEFGLDANLSTNIRHGFVMREIRGPLVARHLVTNKESSDSSYQRNQYWEERLTDLTRNELDAVTNSLATFSEKIDAQIEYLNRSLIRIRSEQAPEGLFDFSVDSFNLQLLKRRCDNAEDYDEFLDLILEFLWAKTNKALESLRSMLFTVTLTNLQSAVEDLQGDLGKHQDSNEISALTSATNLVRPDLRSAIERVASWFTLSGNNEYQDYDLRISFEAGLATVKSYYSHLTIVSKFDSGTLIMAGRTLPFFARLFSILLDNSAFHSGLTSGTLLLQASSECEDGVLYLSVRNNLASAVDLERVRQRTALVNADFGREGASKYIREEGGSGYPKIWKILAHDLGGEHALNVSLTSEGEFLVDIMIEARGIVL